MSLLALAPCAALAQGFANRPIPLVVPWPAGGSTDTHLRKLADLAGKHLGQPVIVENKPGAGGMLGPAGKARRAAPPGPTPAQLHAGGGPPPPPHKERLGALSASSSTTPARAAPC